MLRSYLNLGIQIAFLFKRVQALQLKLPHASLMSVF